MSKMILLSRQTISAGSMMMRIFGLIFVVLRGRVVLDKTRERLYRLARL
jgi:hypothetical protein